MCVQASAHLCERLPQDDGGGGGGGDRLRRSSAMFLPPNPPIPPPFVFARAKGRLKQQGRVIEVFFVSRPLLRSFKSRHGVATISYLLVNRAMPLPWLQRSLTVKRWASQAAASKVGQHDRIDPHANALEIWCPP